MKNASHSDMSARVISDYSLRAVWLAVACLGVALLSPRPFVDAQTPLALLDGQTVTILPDGRELLLGGVVGGRVQGSAWIRDQRTGTVVAAPGLNRPRAWHSATVLPDGSVLVLGGTDGRGHDIIDAERFDPSTGTFDPVTVSGWGARSAHTATLVDGQHLLIAGGAIEGEPVGDVELLDLETWRATSLGAVNEARAYHSATLLADGRTLLWGGRGRDRGLETSGVMVDTDGGGLIEVFTRQPDEPFLLLAASDPADGSAVSLPRRVTLRFSRPIDPQTLNQATVTLAGPGGGIDVTVVAAEGGRLAFITPRTSLEPSSSYLVTVNGVRDRRNRSFPVLSVTFTTTDAVTLPIDAVDDDVWDPRLDGSFPTWRRNTPDTRWQKLPPLKAEPGVTAVSGQVLRLNGSPLAGVTLTIDDQSTMTDATGRFLLVNHELTTGWHELWIDGRTARGRGSFGTFEASIWANSGTTTVLPYTTWMPTIDVAHATTIDSPLRTETVLTTPLIPGLEVRLPAGAVITDHDRRVVRRVSITPIPVDQPPFPLPEGVDVPIYFTVQPGGAYIAVQGTGGYSRGARVIYPNYRRRPAGTAMAFWHYEPDEGRRWYVYGQGTVTADGSQIVPDAGVSIHEFTGAMVAPPSLAPAQGPAPGDPGHGGDPVHLGTGLFVLSKTDLALSDVAPIALSRTYRQSDTVVRSFGIGTTHQYDIFLVGDTFPYTYMDLVLPDGGRVHYTRISSGTSYTDAVYEHTSSPTPFFKSQISWNGNGWNLDLKDGWRITFKEGFNATRPSQSAATSIRDRYGNTITLTRDSAADLTRIASPNGRTIALTYDTSHRVTEARDNGGRTVGYTYDASGRLWKVTDPAGGVTEYTYDTSHRMLTLKDARGIVFLTNHYDANGRVDLQTQADSTTYAFAYTLDGAGKVTQTDVTDPRGIVRRAAYGSSGYLASDTAAFGTSLARTTSFTRNSNNLVTRATDGLGRHTDYGYDSHGNVTSVTRLASTGNAVTTSYTYDATFNLLASVTDPLSHTTTFTRDSVGNVTAITDALSHQTTFSHTASGQPLTVTTPAGTTTFGYDGGDLVGNTDPLGRTTSRFIDAVGRPVRATNPMGQATTHTYDVLNAVTQTTDPLGGVTAFTYDANQNLLTLTDALNHTTTYTYNNMDRVETRTDALSRGESYVYDDNGNVAERTDRKGQVTASTYDALDRLITVTYDDSSTTSYTYDAGDRIVGIDDSVAGTITRTWDLLDRLTEEETPEGTVSYTYDDAGRRTSMTVAGQPTVTYGYDNEDRLTSITQNSAVVGFTYDNADRRTMLTLPNGVTVEYGYDAASQITGLTYKLGSTTLGDLTYTYDLAGNRTSIGGTWARTGLPTALASATYDASNQIATWGSTSFSYDANGNLTNDGSKTYAWNARNQLSTLGGGVSATFHYDGLGRRRAKTVIGASTGFLYDGLNAVQELSSGSPSANILPGLGIDEWLARTDSAGTRHFLTDVLGSTLALADGSGAVQTEYTYEPFGKTTVSGASSANGLQFTGRENDGTGLFYYRARYVDPLAQRFIAEDPIGLEGGLNLFAYAGNMPTLLFDPLGLKPPGTFGPGSPGPGRPRSPGPGKGGGPGPNVNPNAPPGRGPGPGDTPSPTPRSEPPDNRCTWGHRWRQAYDQTNGSIYGTLGKFGTGLAVANSWARSQGLPTWLQVAAGGTGGVVAGGVGYTALEGAILAGVNSATAFPLAFGSWHGGVAVGSAISAGIYPC